MGRIEVVRDCCRDWRGVEGLKEGGGEGGGRVIMGRKGKEKEGVGQGGERWSGMGRMVSQVRVCVRQILEQGQPKEGANKNG